MYTLLLRRIEHLGESPFPEGSKKLVGRDGWRIRAGDYRVLYRVDTKRKEVTILSVAHRRDAYR
ncbi:type II toxin-antitoxin system RelE/ParE family toxin [Patescibacteria group bacterium]|nr:type II toxin-antitoxin system RelE/ParE family toxin [Patescibacteria group bacterium]